MQRLVSSSRRPDCFRWREGEGLRGGWMGERFWIVASMGGIVRVWSEGEGYLSIWLV